MVTMVKMKDKKGKLIALFFVVLMFGSSFTYLVSEFFGNKDQEVTIPQSRIINYELNNEQRALLLKKGYTLIEYFYPDSCLDCAKVKTKLERIVQDSESQIFLQEVSKVSENKIVATSFNGQKIIEDPIETELETPICEILLNKPLWCVTNRV
jgi:hypothetical protein